VTGLPDLAALLAALHAAGVRHVVIGGVAVAAHGFVRATADVDLVPAPDPDNLLALGNALVLLEARLPLAGGRPFAHAEHGGVLRRGGNLTLDPAEGGLDIVQRAPGLPSFAALDATAVATEILGTPVRVCSLQHLREMKQAAARPIDRADLDALPEA